MKHSLYFVARAEGLLSGCAGPFYDYETNRR
nr:MAG TPA: hypothetical protein [Caudoviricetes sp.]